MWNWKWFSVHTCQILIWANLCTYIDIIFQLVPLEISEHCRYFDIVYIMHKFMILELPQWLVEICQFMEITCIIDHLSTWKCQVGVEYLFSFYCWYLYLSTKIVVYNILCYQYCLYYVQILSNLLEEEKVDFRRN